MYENPDEEVDFLEGYAPRFGGFVAGAGLSSLALAGVNSAFGPLAAISIPATLGIYSAGAGIYRYVRDFIKGEEIEGQEQKGSFGDGFRFGYHQESAFPMAIVHELETSLTGRGMDQSHLDSCIRGSANAARRNFKSTMGNLTGIVAGLGLSVLTLGIVPIYKTIRDGIRSFKREDISEIHYPAYVSDLEPQTA
tara:strand:- start:46 stop:627 length:582 start_codon:yes stop_codon:yes gene_type:complete